MKGIVFTEFLDLIEEKFGLEVVDKMITACELETNGSYTQIGNYSHGELIQMVSFLHRDQSLPVNDLLEVFAFHLYGKFKESYPDFFVDVKSSYDFISKVEHHIHQEVMKIYPNSSPPSIKAKQISSSKYEVSYHSNRGLAYFALSMVKACIADFNEKADVTELIIEKELREAKFSISLHD